MKKIWCTKTIKLMASLIYISGTVSWGAPPSNSQPPQVATWGHTIGTNANQAWNITSGAGVKVCILDTGVQKNHPDLQANILGGINLTGGSTSKWDDGHGHGTHIAGVIAAVNNTIGVKGVAYDSKLIIVKVLDNSGNTTADRVAQGVNYCVNNGADIINMSFGIATGSANLANSIAAADAAGIILVGAVGDNANTNILYPAKYPEVISVSALVQNSYLNFSLAPYSNFSATGAGEVDVTAPGNPINSTWIGSSYRSTYGTGIAAAFVSGVSALMLSAGKTELKARPVEPTPLTVEQGGAGVIDALLTVQ